MHTNTESNITVDNTPESNIDYNVNDTEFDEDDEYFAISTFNATHLLDKRREMREVHNILKSKREEYEERMKNIKEKELALAKKRNELTESIIELDKFISDNEIKRIRADQKQKKEEEEKIKSEETINNLKKEIELLKRERDENAEKFQRDSKYHDFLKSAVVLKGDSDPDNVEALMKRYENLEKYRNHLADHIEKKKQELNDKRKKQKEDNENWKKSTIELNHTISTHAKTLERLQKENNKNRKRVESSQANINELQITLGKIEMACKFLYHRINDPHNGSRINRAQQNPDEYKMLKVVGDTISDLTYVLHQFKTLSEQEKQKILKTTM